MPASEVNMCVKSSSSLSFGFHVGDEDRVAELHLVILCVV